MKKEAYIIGIGSHAITVKNLAESENYKIKGFVYIPQNRKSKIPKKISSVSVLKLENLKKTDTVFLALGDIKFRNKIYLNLRNKFIFPKLISKNSIISKNSKILNASIIFPGVIINSNSKINENCIINTGVIIEHDVLVGLSTNISPGSIICGNVKIGNQCLVGAGAIIRDKIKVGSQSIIGVGSNVIKNVSSNTTVIGNPSKKI